MNRPLAYATITILVACAAPARAGQTAIGACGPYDAYVMVYRTVENLEELKRMKCGEKFEIIDEQKGYAAQHSMYVRIRMADGMEGYVLRASATPVREPVRPVAAAVAVNPATLTEVRVADGTEFDVELAATVSSENSPEGTMVNLKVVEPLVVNGVTVLERGALARARITESKKAGRMGHQSEIAWTLEDVVTVEGKPVPALFVLESRLLDASGKSAGVVVATGDSSQYGDGAFAIHRGKPAVVPAGQHFRAFIHGDAVVKLPHGGSPQ
jgi:hypothetical protein